MFDLSDRGFHSRPQVSALLQVNMTALAPLGDMGLGLRETVMPARVPLARFGGTNARKGTSSTTLFIKMGDITLLPTAGLHFHVLPLRAGDLGRLAFLGLLDLKIG